MAFLTPDKIRNEYGLEIKEKIIPNGNKLKPNRKLSNGTGKVQWITIHNTADINEAAGTNDAEQYTRATFNGAMGGVTVHYYIDETDCWQLLHENEVGYHAADGYNGPGNTTSLAIEIIMDGSGFKADVEAERRGALLAAILLHKHGLGIDRLTTHNRWYSRKYCPIYILPHWNEFKSKVEKYLNEIKAPKEDKPEVESGNVMYKIQTGAFLSKDNAEALRSTLESKGFEAIVVYSTPYYKVQVGAFSIKQNAILYKETIETAGFECIIVEVGEEQKNHTASDARDALRVSVGLENADEKYDVDGDGKVTASDAREILRESVGLK